MILYARKPGAVFHTRSARTYVADATGQVDVSISDDVADLIASGCSSEPIYGMGLNPSAIGLFSDIPTLNIPASVKVLQTSGYASPGVGPALLVETSTRTVTAWRTRSNNGRYFELASPDTATADQIGMGRGGDDTATWAAWMAAYPRLKLLAGPYRVSSISIPSNKRIDTLGRQTMIQQIAGQPIGTGIVVLVGQNIEFALDGVSLTGNIATDTAQHNHAVTCYNATARIGNIKIGNLWAYDIRGDAFIAVSVDAYPITNAGIEVGDVYGDNIYRDVVTIECPNVRIGHISGDRVGFCVFNLEPNPQNETPHNIRIESIRGGRVQVVPDPSKPGTGIYIGSLDTDPNYQPASVPPFNESGTVYDVSRALVVRAANVRIGYWRARNYVGLPFIHAYVSGWFQSSLTVDEIDFDACGLTETGYNAYFACGGMKSVRIGSGRAAGLSAVLPGIGQVYKQLVWGDFPDAATTWLTASDLDLDGCLARYVYRVTARNIRMASAVAGVSFLRNSSYGRISESDIVAPYGFSTCTRCVLEDSKLTASTAAVSGGSGNLQRNSLVNGVYTESGTL